MAYTIKRNNIRSNKNELVIIELENLSPNPLNKLIYGEQDILDLLRLVESSNYIEPIIVKKDLTLPNRYIIIDGHRRVRVSNLLKKKSIEAVVLDFNNEYEEKEAIIINNATRHKTTLQRIREGMVLEEIISYKAKLRKQLGKKSVENFPQGLKTRDIVAEIMGKDFSGRTFEKAKIVVLHIDELNGDGFKDMAKKLTEILNESVDNAYKITKAPKEISKLVLTGKALDLRSAEKLINLKHRKSDIIDTTKIEYKLNSIYYGDSVEILNKLMRKMKGKIDCVITDPPFGLDYDGFYKSKYPKFKDSFEYALSTFDKVCKLLRTAIKDNAHLYFFCSHKYALEFKQILIKNKLPVWDNWLTWVKNKPRPVGDYRKNYASKSDIIWFCSSGKKYLNKPLSEDILNFNMVENRYHSSEKPIDLLQDLILNSTIEGETILDPFAGSGTTLIAAKKLKRNYIGVELEKEIYDSAYNKLLKV